MPIFDMRGKFAPKRVLAGLSPERKRFLCFSIHSVKRTKALGKTLKLRLRAFQSSGGPERPWALCELNRVTGATRWGEERGRPGFWNS